MRPAIKSEEETNMSKNSKEPAKSYVPNRESTSGRSNDNPAFRELDRKYESDKARQGTNAGRDSFDHDGRY